MHSFTLKSLTQAQAEQFATEKALELRKRVDAGLGEAQPLAVRRSPSQLGFWGGPFRARPAGSGSSGDTPVP